MPPERARSDRQALTATTGPGARTLPPDLIAAVQRKRLLLAMLRASSQLGYPELTVQDVLNRSGVSRATFYEHFANKEECFLAAFDDAAARLRERLRAGPSERAGPWRDRIRAGFTALLSFTEAEPDATWALLVEARAACPAALVRRDELLDELATYVDSEVRADGASSGLASPMAAVGVVGGIETLLYNRLCREETRGLESLLPSMMHFTVLAYEGREAAGSGLPAAC